MNLPSIDADKANHFIYGSVVAFIVSILLNPIFGAAAVVVVAVAKEVYDKVTKKGNSEILDAAYTVAGGALVLIPQVI